MVLKQTLNSSRLYGQLVTPFFPRSIAIFINFCSLYMNFRVRTWKDCEISESPRVFVEFLVLKGGHARAFFQYVGDFAGGLAKQIEKRSCKRCIGFSDNMIKSLRFHVFHSNPQILYMISVINSRQLYGKPLRSLRDLGPKNVLFL